jgi:hypothetical protein
MREYRDENQRSIEERLQEVKEELERIAAKPPTDRDLARWRELAALEAELLVTLRQRISAAK